MMFLYFYHQYLVIFTMVPRNNSRFPVVSTIRLLGLTCSQEGLLSAGYIPGSMPTDRQLGSPVETPTIVS